MDRNACEGKPMGRREERTWGDPGGDFWGGRWGGKDVVAMSGGRALGVHFCTPAGRAFLHAS